MPSERRRSIALQPGPSRPTGSTDDTENFVQAIVCQSSLSSLKSPQIESSQTKSIRMNPRDAQHGHYARTTIAEAAPVIIILEMAEPASEAMSLTSEGALSHARIQTSASARTAEMEAAEEARLQQPELLDATRSRFCGKASPKLWCSPSRPSRVLTHEAFSDIQRLVEALPAASLDRVAEQTLHPMAASLVAWLVCSSSGQWANWNAIQ
eukprot:139896-Prymnesium_polylepis.1